MATLAEGRSREAWEHTSAVLYMVLASQNPKAARQLSPQALNPYRKTERKQRLTADILCAIGSRLPEAK